MGCFDTVWFNCPACGQEMSEQSKAGDCLLRDYSLFDAPPSILGSLADEQVHCKCGKVWVIKVQTLAQLIPYRPPRDEEPW